MASESSAQPHEFGPQASVERTAADDPSGLDRRSWWAVLRGTVKQFLRDELPDRAAALTYYGVLSLFPALLVLVSMLGVAGESATKQVVENLEKLAPGAARDIMTQSVERLQSSSGTGSVLAIVGLAGALWSASGYVAAFIRTSNAVYEVPEGRPVWKILPLRLAVTLALMLLACASAVIVVFTGGIASQVGGALGMSDAALTVWAVVKWPVLLVLVTLMVTLLFWAAPNAKVKGLTWIVPGSILALLIWMAASAGFAFFVANFGSYNKTYGAIAGVVVFLIWLWITNLAILLGLEFNAEMVRERVAASGHDDEGLFVEPRDTKAWDEEDRREASAER
ncbi:YihY/virulence factor BrkB family protein [Streptomyces flavofungini]|uniref:YihY/virulence factor BrkB family protein n=1 Tax=Streptomyces flavofungini TaxID=68200 RepID=UPI0034DF995C